MSSDRMQKQDAIDLSHHLSARGKAYERSPLKALIGRYDDRPGLIKLFSGAPHEDYFPITSVDIRALPYDNFSTAPASSSGNVSWLKRLFGLAPAPPKPITFTINHAPAPGDNGLNLTKALQYNPVRGLDYVASTIDAFVGRAFQPGYADFKTLIHTGNTDGWARVLQILAEPGDTVIGEEWIYASALTAGAPTGLKFISIDMDDEGMLPDKLRERLAAWDESVKGRRPHLMYTVPVGQNPSGRTMGLERKQAIYDVCVEFDIIILEDDPYYFLQAGQYVTKDARARTSSATTSQSDEEWLASLAPSFLRVDTQGRVIRIDTVSKFLSPGLRLGWFTCSPLFAERLERVGEVATQAPNGLGTAVVGGLLREWTQDGLIRWLRGIRALYTERRDYFVDALYDTFDVERSVVPEKTGGRDVCVAYARGSGMKEKGVRRPLFEFTPPTSGLFIWLKVPFPSYVRHRRGNSQESLEMQFWVSLVENGVAFSPGSFFSYTGDGAEDVPDFNAEGHYRIAFSSVSQEDARKAAQILRSTLREFLAA
ncbi:PLP-dependent transferase [Peniophora sp. CONT]|nr:PLP-dependent transferase [Peniophora sp. CONT]